MCLKTHNTRIIIIVVSYYVARIRLQEKRDPDTGYVYYTRRILHISVPIHTRSCPVFGQRVNTTGRPSGGDHIVAGSWPAGIYE